jgi:hypothetical protein
LENLKEREHVEDLGIHGRIILIWTLKRQNERAWTVFIWLKTEASGRLL